MKKAFIRVIAALAVFFIAVSSLFSQSALAAGKQDIAAARAICYSSLTGNVNHSIILVPLPSYLANRDDSCQTIINRNWHAGGVAKSNYFRQNCSNLDNEIYGGGYTSYVTKSYFEANRENFTTCNDTTAFICCSPSFSD